MSSRKVLGLSNDDSPYPLKTLNDSQLLTLHFYFSEPR